MNLVEGERVFVLEWNNVDWYVFLHIFLVFGLGNMIVLINTVKFY